jgi:hypothetical protein
MYFIFSVNIVFVLLIICHGHSDLSVNRKSKPKRLTVKLFLKLVAIVKLSDFVTAAVAYD